MTPVDAPQLGWESLEARVSKLERRWKIAVAGWILTVALIMLPGCQHGGETFAENLRVRQLSVVNEKGTSRIILGAPLPDPVMGGKSQERRSPATGLVLNDSDGNERGGLAMLDDGTLTLCFDAEGRERVCVFTLPQSQSGFLVNDDKGTTRFQIVVGPDGSPKLEIFDEKGKLLVRLPDRKPNEKKK